MFQTSKNYELLLYRIAKYYGNSNPKTVSRLFILHGWVQPQRQVTEQVLGAWQFDALSEVRNIHKAGEVCQLINEIEQLTDVIGDRWCVRVLSFQMFFINFANTCNKKYYKSIHKVQKIYEFIHRLEKIFPLQEQQ